MPVAHFELQIVTYELGRVTLHLLVDKLAMQSKASLGDALDALVARWPVPLGLSHHVCNNL